MIQHGFNIDDFVLLKLLLEKNKVCEIGKIMGLSQPAISQRLRSIGRRLSIKIHDRLGRGIILTAKGEQLAVVASRIVALLESLKIEPDSIKEPPDQRSIALMPPSNQKPEIPFKISGRSMCFSYLTKK